MRGIARDSTGMLHFTTFVTRARLDRSGTSRGRGLPNVWKLAAVVLTGLAAHAEAKCNPNCVAGQSCADGTTCFSCAAGTYSDGTARSTNTIPITTCTACPAGKYLTTTGASAPSFCVVCAAGLYQGASGSSMCSSCPLMFYSSTSGNLKLFAPRGHSLQPCA